MSLQPGDIRPQDASAGATSLEEVVMADGFSVPGRETGRPRGSAWSRLKIVGARGRATVLSGEKDLQTTRGGVAISAGTQSDIIPARRYARRPRMTVVSRLAGQRCLSAEQ